MKLKSFDKYIAKRLSKGEMADLRHQAIKEKKMLVQKQSHGNYDKLLMQELQDPALALAYLNETVRNKDSRVFVTALKDVIAARKDLSADIRDELYGLLAEGDTLDPLFWNVLTIVKALGFDVKIVSRDT